MSIPNLSYVANSNIDRSTESVSGGYSRLLFCPEEYVDFTTNYPGYFLPNPATGLLDQQLITSTLASRSNAFYDARMPKSKMGYTEEQKEGDGGPYMLITVTCSIPFTSVDNHLQLDRLKYHRFILLVELPDGTVKVIGNKGCCAYLAHTEDRGSTQKDVPGTLVKFTCEQEDKPLIYTLALPI